MDEGFLPALGMSPWGPVALAFLLGVALGWAIWGAGRSGRVIDKKESLAREKDEPKEIVVIKAELQAARRLLDQGDDQDAAVAEQLSALDETVKRANGRLTTILAAVKRLAGKV